MAVTSSAAAERLSGTVTFLLSDVAGSTAIWEAEPDSAGAAIARYDEIVGEAVGRHG